MDKVQHFEIPADDLARGRKFYQDAFSWDTQDWPMPDGSVYVALRTGPVDDKGMSAEKGYIGGGMFKRSPQAAQGPVIVVTVPEINAALEKIRKAGGTVLGEVQKVADMGLYVYAKDTEDNTIGIWQALKNG